MSREEYLKKRNSGEISIELLYDYYVINCVTPIVNSYQEFANNILPFIQIFNPPLDKVIDFYDKKYSVNILKDSKGNILKIY